VSKTVFAIGAHPDDIEFMMGGTLILLKQAGCEIHCMNIANGNCGTTQYDSDEIVRIRLKEAQDACKLIGARHHPPLCPDIEILYTNDLLHRLGSIVREVAPDILLLQSPEDYMEDHTISVRLAVTAAFCRSMRNFPVDPPRPPVMNNVAVYHALPYGLRDSLRRTILPEFFVDITSVIEMKTRMLACHQSQKKWLDESQGLDSYLKTMQEMSAEVGRMSKKFKYAEGWLRHNHLGFCGPSDDPLASQLANVVQANKNYPGARKQI
jgi:LmbE family N-acetylglucosaminyl deacetylase